MFKILLYGFEPSLALKYSKMTTAKLPFPSPSSDEQCVMNIKYILAEIERLPGSLRYPKTTDGESYRPIVVLHLGKIVYYLQHILPHLSGPYATYPLVAPAIGNIMPAIQLCIEATGRFVAASMLCTAAGDLCHELQTVLASVLRKPDSEMEIHYWRSIAFGKAWRDRDQEEQRVRADAQGIVLASGIDAKFTDSDTPRDLSRTDSASSS